MWVCVCVCFGLRPCKHSGVVRSQDRRPIVTAAVDWCHSASMDMIPDKLSLSRALSLATDIEGDVSDTGPGGLSTLGIVLGGILSHRRDGVCGAHWHMTPSPSPASCSPSCTLPPQPPPFHLPLTLSFPSPCYRQESSRSIPLTLPSDDHDFLLRICSTA